MCRRLGRSCGRGKAFVQRCDGAGDVVERDVAQHDAVGQFCSELQHLRAVGGHVQPWRRRGGPVGQVVLHLEEFAVEVEWRCRRYRPQELHALAHAAHHLRVCGTPVGLQPHADHGSATAADHEAGAALRHLVQCQKGVGDLQWMQFKRADGYGPHAYRLRVSCQHREGEEGIPRREDVGRPHGFGAELFGQQAEVAKALRGIRLEDEVDAHVYVLLRDYFGSVFFPRRSRSVSSLPSATLAGIGFTVTGAETMGLVSRSGGRSAALCSALVYRTRIPGVMSKASAKAFSGGMPPSE